MGFMKTRWTDLVDRNNPLPEYPRPQMERENWMSMNGVYDYAIVDSSVDSPFLLWKSEKWFS